MSEEQVEGSVVPRSSLLEWEERLGVTAGITERGPAEHAFDMALRPDATPAVGAHWDLLAAEFPSMQAVVAGRQVHGADIRWHDSPKGLTITPDIDGHATARRGALLTVTLADCIPVYMIDPKRRAIALLHCGWRGIAAGLLERGAQVLSQRMGSSVSDIVMHCGVGICGLCYEVGSEVLEALGLPSPPQGKGHLDLRGLLADRAVTMGLTRVSVSDCCSAHDAHRFFSHRRSRGADGRMVAYLGL